MAASFVRRAFGKQSTHHLRNPSRTLGTPSAKENVALEKHPDSTEHKPKYPPGAWGDMDRSYAWQWFDLKSQFLNIPSVQKRLELLIDKNTSSMISQPPKDYRIHNPEERWKHLIDYAATTMFLDSINDHPATLEFRQYATKTCMLDLPWDASAPQLIGALDSESIKEALSGLKQSLSDHIEFEYDIKQRDGMKADIDSDTLKAQQCKSLIRCISETLITQLHKSFPHLRSCQYDENVIVRALWHRYGIEREKKVYQYDPDEEEFETVQDQCLATESFFDGMLRSHLPLPQFETRNEGVSVGSNPPKLKYKYQVYGQDKPSNKRPKSVIAGHKLGDPCEFGMVGLLSTCDTSELDIKLGLKTAQDCRLAMGLTKTFAWLAAQACNQGFSHVVDMTYPLTSQTILTDGQNFSFLAYQLNTLELWKDDTANKLVNLCWHTEEVPLYHSIENGKVREFNDDVLQMLVRMFMLAPADRGHDMKPTISDKEYGLHTKTDFIPEKIEIEEVVEEEKYIVT